MNHHNGLCFLILQHLNLFPIIFHIFCTLLFFGGGETKLFTALQFFSGIWTIHNVMFSVSVTTRKKQNKAFP